MDDQRRRLLQGVARALAARGYAEMSVEHVLTEAGLSRSIFYAHFGNKREAVLATHEWVLERLAGAVTRACAVRGEWSEKVKAGVAAGMAEAIREPEGMHLLLLDQLAAEPQLVDRVLDAYDFLARLLRNGREQSAHGPGLPALTERMLVGAATSVVGMRLARGRAEDLRQLEPQLVQLLLMPYVGMDEAWEAAYGEPD